VNYTMFNQGEIAVLLDSGLTAPPMVWVNPQNTADLVLALLFRYRESLRRLIRRPD